MIFIGILLVVSVPLFFYAAQYLSQQVKVNEASDTVNVLAQKADAVYALGPGTRDYVWVTIPSGVQNVRIGNKSVQLTFSSIGDVNALTRVNVTGYLPTAQGTYRIVVEMTDSSVFIGPINDTIPPQVISTSPSGVIKINNPLLSATTNEAATCKYDTSDLTYDSMATTFSGSSILHTQQLSNQPQASYLFYARCRDLANNTMTSSSLINYTIALDITAPTVIMTSASPLKLFAGHEICVNATATDNLAVSQVWTMLSSPLTPPYSASQNFTLSDTGAWCAGSAGDNVYGAMVLMQVAGLNFVNTSFANDTSSNTGFQNPFPNIQINVSSNVSVGPGQGLTYVPVSLADYLKSPNQNLNLSDFGMSTKTNVTMDVTDDDKNTPPSVNRFKSSSSFWEGFSFSLAKTPQQVDFISIRLKVVDTDVLPFNLTVYTYTANLTHIMLMNATNFTIDKVMQTGVERGFNEVMITNTIKSAPSNAYIKIRIVPQNTTGMLNKVAHISEADFGII
ncbi:hypothetical protein HZB00_03175 [Candidatus Woesearchaeota archaeon]|nr:hypothetical protein [Candidatus Woesearchaeota archaeon]